MHNDIVFIEKNILQFTDKRPAGSMKKEEV